MIKKILAREKLTLVLEEKHKLLVKNSIRELGANLMAVNLYPLGLWSSSEEVGLHPPSAKNHRPVLLLHGVIHNRSAFISMKRGLEKSGWHSVFSMNYSTRHGLIEKMVEQLQGRVEEIISRTGSQKIDIVAHSLGGIVARYYMTKEVGRGKIKNLVTLGTPHQGTNTSFILKGLTRSNLHEILCKGSSLLHVLSNFPIEEDTKITSIYSSMDWTLWPRSCGHVVGTPTSNIQNIQVHSVGHMGLLYSREVLNHIMQALS